jgi:two-component system OmpR family sensor kinase/two-component system sensor histidine kinase BaeS
MRNTLILKLMGAFLLVIAIGATVISILTSQATQNAFTLYTTRSGQVLAQRLAPILADYYAQSNSWQGVETLLQSDLSTQVGTGMGMGQGRGNGAGRQNGGMMMTGTGQRLVLANEKGVVIADTSAQLLGKNMTASQQQSGAAILLNDQSIGTILVTPSEFASPGTPAGEFLQSVNQALISSVLIAGVIAILLGGILFLQITSPLRQLKKAAAAIAAGNLQQRVKIHSRDEFGELGQTFNHMAENLASAETLRRHMVADVAHELRTPLAAIQATLEGMQDGVLPLDEEQVSALYSETILLNRLVGDLKLLSLAEAGQLNLERMETDPGALIQQLVERMKPQADPKKIHLETQLQAGLPEVWIDSDRIAQVLNNLVGNALRYTPPEGTITVRAAAAEDGVQISVSDSGPGISAEDLPYIFDRFYRADKSRTRASGGSGLGLAIVRQLVEAHGGRIWADSSSAGSTFHFTLPAVSQQQDSTPGTT